MPTSPGRWPALLAILALATAWGAGATAQGLHREADPEGAIVEELVVRARAPGPAWWRVSRGTAEVWVLGVPAALPKGTRWSDAAAAARLQGADALILPGRVKIGALKAIGFFIGHRKQLHGSQPLEQGLPAPLARRFAAARERLGKPEKRYAAWRPAVGGVMLDSDFRRTVRLDPDEPVGHVRALARRAQTRERQPPDYDGGPVLTAILTMSGEAERDCLEDSLAEVEAGPGRIQAAAQDWAGGDVRAALAAERGYDRCLAALPGLSDLLTRGQADMAAAIAAALARPGRSVAVVELRSLLARGGVLDRLRAQGLEITAPGNVP